MVAVFLFLLNFYRDPERFPPTEQNIIVSPADGRLISKRKILKNQILWSQKGNKKIDLKEIVWNEDLMFPSGYVFGIYMSPFDVHVNRAPINGRIVKVKSFEGRLLRLGNKKSELLNRRTTIVIEHPKGFRVVVVQIAALIVGKIECYVREGEIVQVGQRIGKIKFGSQVDLIIPELPELKILKDVGTKVFAGETVLAKFSLNDK